MLTSAEKTLLRKLYSGIGIVVSHAGAPVMAWFTSDTADERASEGNVVTGGW